MQLIQVTTDAPHGVEVSWGMETNPVKVYSTLRGLACFNEESLVSGREAALCVDKIHTTFANSNTYDEESCI